MLLPVLKRKGKMSERVRRKEESREGYGWFGCIGGRLGVCGGLGC